MATMTVYAEGSSKVLSRDADSAAQARAGTGDLLHVSNDIIQVGMVFGSSNWNYEESFISFDTTPLSVATSITGVVMWLPLTHFNTTFNGPNVEFTMEARAYDFGSSVETSDFVPEASIGSHTLLATLDTSNVSYYPPTNSFGDLEAFTSQAAFPAAINTAGDTRILLNSNQHRLGQSPAGIDNHRVWGWWSSQATQAKLVVTYTAPSADVFISATFTADSSMTTTLRADRQIGQSFEASAAFTPNVAADRVLSSSFAAVAQFDPGLIVTLMPLDASFVAESIFNPDPIVFSMLMDASFEAVSSFSGTLSGVEVPMSATWHADAAMPTVLTLERQITDPYTTAPTFARASIAYEPDGDVVIAHAARYGAMGGANLLTAGESTGFEAAGFSKSGTTIVQDAALAPDGTMTMDKLVEGAGNAPHYIEKDNAITDGLVGSTVSVFAKSAGRNWMWLAVGGTASYAAWFDLDTGTLGTVRAGITASMTHVGDGVYRCTASFAGTIVNATSDQWRCGLGIGASSSSYLGNGTSGIYIWHPQIENQTLPTPWRLGGTSFQGLLSEEGTTNHIRNSIGAGTLGSGQHPTNWSSNAEAGLTYTSRTVIVDPDYPDHQLVEFRLQNTSGITKNFWLYFDSATQVVTTSGEIWSVSADVWVHAGSLDNSTNFGVGAWWSNAAGGYIGENGTDVTIPLTRTRIRAENKAATATTERVMPGLRLYGIPNGTDVTIRVARPQLEKKSYATTYHASSGSASVRQAEQLNADNVVPNLPSGSWTVEGWVSLPNLISVAGAHLGFFGARNNSGVPRITVAARRGSGSYRFAFWDSTNLWYESSYSIPAADTPVHLAVTYDGTTVSMYANGVLVGSQARVLPGGGSYNEFYLGRCNSNSEFLNGFIEDIRVSNRVRSATEIAAVAASSEPAPWDDSTTYKLPLDGNLLAFGSFGPDTLVASSSMSAELQKEVTIPSASMIADTTFTAPALIERGFAASFVATAQFSTILSSSPAFDASFIAVGYFNSTGLFTFRPVGVLRIPRLPDYRVVVGEINGAQLAEVPFKNLQYSFALNDAGSCSFTLPLEHEKTTKALLWPGKREILVYRDHERVWGGYLWFAHPTVNDPQMRFSAEGWFSRLHRRFIDETVNKEEVDQLDIAWWMINFTQQKTDGDLGITRFNPAETSGIERTRRYHEWDRVNIAEELISLSEVASGFDFEITPDKEWKTYFPSKGNDTDIVFDLDVNVDNFDIQYDAGDLANEFTALGSGERKNRCIVTVADVSSRSEFGLLQAQESYSSIKHYDTLAHRAESQLDIRKTLRRTPQISLVPKEPYFGEFVTADRVRVKANKGYIQEDDQYLVTAQVVQVADSGRESQTVFLQEMNV